MKIRKIAIRLLSVVVIALILCNLPIPNTMANSGWSFNDPIEFYDQMRGKGKLGKFLCTNGNIYFANKSKLASNSKSLRYLTIGYTIKVSNNSTFKDSITINIAYDNKTANLPNAGDCTAVNHKYVNHKDGNYYGVEKIPFKDIAEQCYNKDKGMAEKVFSGDTVHMIISPIMTTRKNGVVQGGIEERKKNGEKYGEVTNKPAVSGGRNYYLANNDDLTDFTSTFKSYNKDELARVNGKTDNFTLTITYNISPGELADESSYTLKNGNVDFGNDTTYTKVRLFGRITLPTQSNIKFKRKGYHLESGKEWKNSTNGKLYAAGGTYSSEDINPSIKDGSASTTLIADWKNNTYTVKFNSNGGTGTMADMTGTYDKDFTVPPNGFKNAGKEFIGWKVKEGNNYLTVTKFTNDASMYTSDNMLVYNNKGNLVVKNLTAVDNGTITFEAQWQPRIYRISLHKDLTLAEAANDTSPNSFYVTYGSHFSLESSSSSITNISLPTKKGHDFKGYYETYLGTGLDYVDSTGKINFSPTLLTSDKVLYASWEAKKVTLTLDANTTGKAGVTVVNGTQTFTVAYGTDFPTAVTPTTNGYTFKGYFSERNGQGTCYYTPYMGPVFSKSELVEDTTLYAYWVDEVKPTVVITPESSGWTNSNDNTAIGQTDDGYKITFKADDKGTGIKELKIYKENTSGGFTLIKTVTSANYTHTETREGITRYKAVATDKAGNVSSEKYCTIYYDKSSPKILDESNGNMDSMSNVSGEIYATDYQD